MSDQPGHRHRSTKTPSANGWFVPASASTAPNTRASSTVPDGPAMISNQTPQQTGGWYVPAGAHVPTPARSADQPRVEVPILETPVVEMPAVEPVASPMVAAEPIAVQADPLVAAEPDVTQAEPPPIAAAAEVPGAALSNEIDYNNYVPGVGFVAANAPRDPGVTSAASAAQPVLESLAIPPIANNMTNNNPFNNPAASSSPALRPTPANASSAIPQNAASVNAASSMPAAPAPDESLTQKFGDVEQSVQVLRRKYTAGSLTGDQLRAELRKLMILDDGGNWWMIGMESDRWYKYNGKDWLQATPSGRQPEPASAVPPNASQTMTVDQPITANPMPLTATIPLDEYGMPLPQRVPIQDLGATMVNRGAPYLGNASAIDDQRTVPMRPVTDNQDTLGMTQPNATVRGATYVPADSPAIPSPAPNYGQPAANAGQSISADGQPNYGERPTQLASNRTRLTGCVVRAALVAVFLALIGTLVVVIGAVAFYYSQAQTYDKAIADLTTTANSGFQTTRILDGGGSVLAEINDPNGGRRVRVSLADISPYLQHATVSTEDQRYYENAGFDIVGIARAAIQNIAARGTVSGASTITQQLARALVFDPNTVANTGVQRKLIEIVVAAEISRRYTKEQILEMYLNQIPYGNFSYGIEAAAESYFHKRAKDLNLAESALLAGLPQAPAKYDPVQNREAAFGRMDEVVQRMVATGCLPINDPTTGHTPLCITQATIDASVVQVSLVKTANYQPPNNNYTHPHFVNYVLQQLEDTYGADAIYKAGFTVYTTLDPALQAAAEKSVVQHIGELASRHVTNGAVLAVRPSDGAILAMVGSANFNDASISGQVNITLAPRQPGSSIKPFVYLTGLEPAADGSYMTPATIFWDVPSCFGDNNNYCPPNYDQRFHGPQTMRTSLANSFNVPAVKALQYDTIERFKVVADQAGIKFPQTQPEAAGLGTALGGAEVRMIDLVRGYSMLADQGKRLDGFFAISKITKSNNGVAQVVYDAKDHLIGTSQVADPGIVYLLTSILSDNIARAPEFGTNSALHLTNGHPAAAKTGTTNDFRDNWTMGYTANDIVVGVWVGNADNTPMINVQGVTGAGPIWNDVMTAATNGKPVVNFPVPGNVGQTTICADFGTADFPQCQNRRQEVFIASQPPPPITSILQTLTVDQFTGFIANGNCPDFTTQQVFLKINDNAAIDWLNNNATGQQWAQAQGLTLPITTPPTQQCDANTPKPHMVIASPAPNQTINGLIQISGAVNNISNFKEYRLELAQAANPNAIASLAAPIRSQSPTGNDSAFLGGWDTSNVPDGQYLLRVRAFDNAGHSALKTVAVTVNNAAAPQPVAPTLAPTSVFGNFPTLQPPGFAPTSTSPASGGNRPSIGATAIRPLFPPTATKNR